MKMEQRAPHLSPVQESTLWHSKLPGMRASICLDDGASMPCIPVHVASGDLMKLLCCGSCASGTSMIGHVHLHIITHVV